MVNGMIKVFRFTALVLGTLIAAAACASAPPDNQTDACSMLKDNRSWYRAAARTERKWDVPVAMQLAFIRKESSFDRAARPERRKILGFIPGRRLSSARGYAQALDGTWNEYQKNTGKSGASRKSFADSTDFIGWYVDSTSRRTGLARDDAYSQYLAYHEGAGGYMRGTWRQKPEVKRRASVVATMTTKYEVQLQRCERQLKRGIPLIPFI